MSRVDFIETFTGKRFRPLAPVVKDICIDDIAHALSNQCRFSGHVRQHYSVAEHSVRVATRLRALGATRLVQLWGLLHDASEAYLVDLPSPIKHAPEMMPYRVAEATLMHAICLRFGLPLEEPDMVAWADGVLLATEARDLMPYNTEHWKSLVAAPLETKIEPWTARDAEASFLYTFERLRNR